MTLWKSWSRDVWESETKTGWTQVVKSLVMVESPLPLKFGEMGRKKSRRGLRLREEGRRRASRSGFRTSAKLCGRRGGGFFAQSAGFQSLRRGLDLSVRREKGR